MAMRMYPAWTMGLLMLYLVKNSRYKDVLRVDKKGLLGFAKWMAIITIFRIIVLKLLTPPDQLHAAHEAAMFIPWQATMGVFWEDMCHTVPLVLLGRMFKKTKWYKFVAIPLMLMVMISFGSGHVYQGVFAAAMISFYIPVTIRLGKKYGFGTVMICHMLYDFITIMSVRLLTG